MGLLRFLFALSVLSAHSGPVLGLTFIGGKMAVQSFFILSGFYMSLILHKKYIKNSHSYKLFITNRLLRIYPTYLIVLFLSIIVYYILFTQGTDSRFNLYWQYKDSLNFLTFGYLFFSNFFIIGMDFVMFMGLDVIKETFFLTNNYLGTKPLLHNFMFIPQAWTLSLELMFYVIAPFLFRKKLQFILFLIVLSILLRLYIYSLGLHREPWTNRFFPTELLFFLMGILSYRIYDRLKTKKYFYASLGLFIFFVIVTLFYSFLPSYHETFNILQDGYFGLLFLAIPFIFQLTKDNVVDKIFGFLSYPIYISHVLVVDVLRNISSDKNSLFSLEAIIVTVIFSAFLVVFIEIPINHYRQKRLQKKK